MTQEEAREKLLATGFCSESTVSKYLEAAQYIQRSGWKQFEADYDFAPYRYVPKMTKKIEKQRLEESHTLKIDFRHHLFLAGVKVEDIDFVDPE